MSQIGGMTESQKEEILINAAGMTSEEQYKCAEEFINKGCLAADIDCKQEKDLIVNLLEMSSFSGYYAAKLLLANIYNQGTIADKGSADAKNLFLEIVNSKDPSLDPNIKAEAYYCLGVIAEYCLCGEKRNVDTIKEAIKYYNSSVKLKTDDMRGNFALARSYLDLYYEIEANIQTRDNFTDKEYKTYREKAKEYIEIAEELNSKTNDSLTEEYKTKIKVYKQILNDEEVKFTELKFDKDVRKFIVQNIMKCFWLKENERKDLFHAISAYFLKKDLLHREVIGEYKNSSQKESFDVIYGVCKEFFEGEELKQIFKQMVNSLPIDKRIEGEYDFSACAVNFNKEIEKIIKTMFEVGFKNYKKEKEQQDQTLTAPNQTTNQVDQLQKTILEVQKNDIENELAISYNNLGNQWHNLFDDKSAQEFFKKLVGASNFQGKGKEFCWNRVQGILSTNLSDTQKKNLKEYKKELSKKLHETSDCEEKDRLNDIKDFIDEILTISEQKKELRELNDKIEKANRNAPAKEEKTDSTGKEFTMGSVYYYLFEKGSVNEDVIEFVKKINLKMDESEIKLKLFELVTKIELYRVIVRNPSSHTDKLSLDAFEEGMSLCFLQDNSIFKLIGELFGDYIKQLNVGQEYDLADDVRNRCKKILEDKKAQNQEQGKNQDDGVGIS